MKRVIINADDLGKSHLVNKAIAEALKNHIITSTTILANSNTWEEIHNIIKENTQASFGLHLNLTEGQALTNSQILKKYKIVDDNNNFTKYARSVKDLPKELREAIKEEWDAQFRKVISEEHIPISHVDGHHHIHTRFVYIDILVPLLKKYKIQKVRNRYKITYHHSRECLNKFIGIVGAIFFSDSMLRKYKPINSAFDYIHTIVENKKWRRIMKESFNLTDYFNSYENQVNLSNKGLTIPQNVTIELMCHPGHPLYKKECEMIKDFTISKLHRDISYINYNEL